MNYYEINGKQYPIVNEHTLNNPQIAPSGTKVVEVGIDLMTDYKWHLKALKSRLEEPHLYVTLGEDVMAVITNLVSTIMEQTTKETCERYYKDFKICFDYIFGLEAWANA